MFNNPYAPYQQPYQQQYQQPQYQQPQADERIFVPNATAAEAYLVAAGGFVRLWDSNKPVFYEKRADMNGRQYPMMTYEYHEYKPAAQPAAPDYESRFRAIEERLTAFERGAHNDTNE